MIESDSPLGTRVSLSERLTRHLSRRILNGEWESGDKLPSESELASAYEVSRVTVRTALQALEVRGLIRTRHGAGSFVQQLGDGIVAGLPQLQSISETIRELGHTPEIVWGMVRTREATDHEAEQLELKEDEREVLHAERAFFADGEPIAYSIDRIPVARTSEAFRESLGAGSMFKLFEEHGMQVSRAVASIHAEHEPDLAWPETQPSSPLYVVLEQVHYDHKGATIALSQSYFVDSRFEFRVLRTR